jgi:DNA-binding response OmpR family regulator
MDKKKILVVDDEEQILSLIEKKLKASNYDCVTASRAKEGIALAKSSQPNLILLDIALPDMDGYSLAKELKKDKGTREIPIIFLTGKDLEPRAINERIGETEACGYLMKPCSLKELLDKINATIG